MYVYKYNKQKMSTMNDCLVEAVCLKTCGQYRYFIFRKMAPGWFLPQGLTRP